MTEHTPLGAVVRNKFCPKCRKGRILYSGNYFCERYGDGCDWAMSERNSEFNRDIIRTFLIQEREEALAEGNEDRVARMDFHLINLEERGV